MILCTKLDGVKKVEIESFALNIKINLLSTFTLNVIHKKRMTN